MRNSIIAFIFFASAASAQEEKLTDVRGLIRAIDTKAGTVTLQLPLSDKQQALSLASKEVPVTNPLGQKLTLGDLREELRIIAKVRNDAEIVAIQVDGPYHYGVVRKVEAADRKVTIRNTVSDRTFQVPTSATVVDLDTEAPFERLKPGEAARVLFSLDKKKILQVQTGKKISARDPYLRTTRYYGVLGDVDHAKRTVHVMLQSADPGTVKTHEVSAEVVCRLIYSQQPIEEIPFNQVAKWVKVYYFVDRDTNRVIAIDAETPLMIRRKVVRIDAKAITVEDDGKEKTLELAPDARVKTPRGEAKLADIAVGRIVNCGLTLDRRQVAILYLWDK